MNRYGRRGRRFHHGDHRGRLQRQRQWQWRWQLAIGRKRRFHTREHRVHREDLNGKNKEEIEPQRRKEH